MDIARYAIRRPSNIWLLILLCLIGGVFGYQNVNRLEDPEFVIKEAVVVTPYPGADAQTVEREVTDVLETAIQRMPQLDEIESRSVPGMSELRVRIRGEYDASRIPQVWTELRRRVGDVESSLPPGAAPPIVNDDFGDVFGIYYAVTGDGLTLTELHEAAKEIRRGLLTAQGVGQVEIAGVIAQQYIIEISQAQLAALGVSPQELAGTIEGAQTDLFAGSVQTDGLRLRVSPTGAYETIEELRRLPVGAGPSRILLGDIATIRRDTAEQPSQIIHFNGQPALTIGISGLSAVNIVDVGAAVDRRLAELAPDIPLGVELHPIYDQPGVVDSAVNRFALDLLISLTIVTICLCLFMGLKAGATISSILLLSVGGTFFIMYAAGIELERVSLAALVIAMGMLVDNALVICDGIQVRMKRGQSALRAARDTLTATQWPLLGATIIGILAFSGVGLSDDQSGEFLFSLFIVILISLMLSWVLAITVVPMLAYYWLAKPSRREDDDADEDGVNEDGAGAIGGDGEAVGDEEVAADEDWRDPAFSGRIYNSFRTVVGVSLRHSILVVIATVALTVLSLVGFANLPQSFFPPAATPIGFVDLHTRSGGDIHATNARAAEMEALIAEQFPEVRGIARLVGQGGTRFMLTYSPQQPDSSYAQLMLLVDEADDLDPILERINLEFPDIFPDLDVYGLRLVFGANPAARVEARFSGPSPETLRRLSEEAQSAIKREGALINVRDNWRHREIVLRPRLDLDRMAEAGVTRQDVQLALLTVSDGAEIGVMVEGEEQRAIVLRAPGPERPSPDELLDTMVWSAAAEGYIPLRQITDGVEIDQVEEVIHRLNRQRVIAVRAEPPPGMDPSEARERIVNAIESITLPPGYTMEWGGVYEDSSGAEDALINTIIVPYLIMFIITILMFGAFRQAIVIWLVVPMAICGVTLGLGLTGVAFGFLALFGLLSLSGLLLKNAIVLVDEIENQIRAGKPRRIAIVEGATSRLQPIVLLAVTTMLGMVPLLGDPLFVSMAISMMGGVGVSAALTLVVVPCLYDLIISKKHGRREAPPEGYSPKEATA